MDITVKCPCGSHYSFTESPVNGHLCFPVACPNCGADGTALANEYIRKSESGELAREQELERRRTNSWWRRFLPRPAAHKHSESPHQLRFGLGVVGALVGGFAGMMMWYGIGRSTGYEIGYVAWAVGAFAGLGARLAMG